MTLGKRIELTIDDMSGPTRDAFVVEPLPRLAYRVTAKAGLVKNGRACAHGEVIFLDEQTASRFIALGDVEKEQ